MRFMKDPPMEHSDVMLFGTWDRIISIFRPNLSVYIDYEEGSGARGEDVFY